MILKFLTNVLLTDVNNLFEDVSIIENLNEYSGTSTKDKTFTIKSKNDETQTFLFSKEKTSDINIAMASLINPEDNYYVSHQKIKLTGSRIFIDLKWKNQITLIIDSQSFECKNSFKTTDNEEANNIFEIWKLKATKFVKSYGSIFLYVFFENTYVKFNVLDVKLIVN